MPNLSDLPRFIVFRAGSCRQYCFASHEGLAAFASRKPYRTELLKVLPIGPDGEIGRDFSCIGAVLAVWASAHGGPA